MKEKLKQKILLLEEKNSELDKLNLVTLQIPSNNVVTAVDHICKIRENMKEIYLQSSEETNYNIANCQPTQKEVDIIIKSSELMGYVIKVILKYILYITNEVS